MNSKDIIAKPVVAIRMGRIIGKIRYPIVDVNKQEVIGFIVDDEKWFMETKIIIFPLIRGMGKDVITVEDDTSIMPVSNLKAIQKQLEENVQLIGHKVITETGRLLGFIEEFSFNPSTGRIDAYKIKDNPNFIGYQEVLSIGRELIVVKESASFFAETAQMTFEKDNCNLNSIFERRQMEFVLGKRLLRSLEADDGCFIAHEGDVINEDIIRRARNRGKFTELIMSIDSQ